MKIVLILMRERFHTHSEQWFQFSNKMKLTVLN